MNADGQSAGSPKGPIDHVNIRVMNDHETKLEERKQPIPFHSPTPIVATSKQQTMNSLVFILFMFVYS